MKTEIMKNVEKVDNAFLEEDAEELNLRMQFLNQSIREYAEDKGLGCWCYGGIQ